MNKFETDYKQLLADVMHNGIYKQNRTGVFTNCLFNKSLTIDLCKGFPLITGKKMYFDKALHEYIWIKDGLHTLTYLHEHGIHWWDQYADKNGNLGKTYGYQLRSFNGEIDQLEYIHNEIKNNTRRAHITLWNPSELNETILPPCYTGMTFMVQDSSLNMSVQLRSSDLFLGLPYDIAVMALLLTQVARFNDLVPYQLGIQITDAHIYDNHTDQVNEYINSRIYVLPRLIKGIETPFLLANYQHGELIKAPLNN